MKRTMFLLPIFAAVGLGGCHISVNDGWGGDGALGDACESDWDCESLCCVDDVCSEPPSDPPAPDECAADDDCLMGEYCDLDSAVCIETDFCFSDAECADGLVCDEDRVTCVPGEEPAPEPQCTADAECPAGAYCALDAAICIATSLCVADVDCAEALTCDEARGTCIPGEDPLPTCEELGSQEQCLARADCIPVYTGINCSCGPDCVCQGVEPNCVCERFDYFACAPAPET